MKNIIGSLVTHGEQRDNLKLYQGFLSVPESLVQLNPRSIAVRSVPEVLQRLTATAGLVLKPAALDTEILNQTLLVWFEDVKELQCWRPRRCMRMLRES